MDTRFLESFMLVVDKGSIAAAARHLGVTAAAVTQRLQVLEGEIGTRLLARSGRTMVPTSVGSAVVARARAILRGVEDLRSIVVDEPAGALRLGAVATAMTGLLPDLLKRCSTAFPRIDIHIAPGTSRDLYPKVLAGEIDAAIIVQPEFALPKSCAWRVLRHEPMMVIAPGSVASSDPREILTSHPFIRYDHTHWGGRLADRYLRHAKIRPRERFELDSLDAIAVLVDQGLGVSLVPDWAPPWPAGLTLKKLPIHKTKFVRRIGLVWLQASARAHLVRAFLGQEPKRTRPAHAG